MTLNRAFSETTLLRDVSDALRSRLPAGWSLARLGQELATGRDTYWFDAAFSLVDPRGESGKVVVEAKSRPIEAREVNSLLDKWERVLLPLSNEYWGTDRPAIFMVISPFLGPSARERLAEAGVSYADATGNMRFATQSPAVFIQTEGAPRNPWRENVPLRSLQGRRSARVVRGFLDYHPPFGIRELASQTGNAPASVSRVADLLERESILERESPRGAIVSLDWERLLRRWAVDYDFSGANKMLPYLEPRGLSAFFDKLRDLEITYAVTGSFAAARYAPAAEPRLASLYVRDPDETMNRLGLRPAETGANVLMGQPFDPVVFDRTERAGGITYANITQVAEDLMTGPGRSPAEAESLVEWMRSREESWRFPLTKTT